MSAPVLTPSVRPAVGKFYMVPCVHVVADFRTHWMRSDGFVPILGPKHRDADLAADWDHYHVDWRFVGSREYQRLLRGLVSNAAHGQVLTSANGRMRLDHAPVARRIQCKRVMADFPSRSAAHDLLGGDISTKWVQLERAHACQKLKPGNICPHRGIDLTPFIKEDGTVICPGHGLRWDTTTGDLLPHHGATQ